MARPEDIDALNEILEQQIKDGTLVTVDESHQIYLNPGCIPSIVDDFLDHVSCMKDMEIDRYRSTPNQVSPEIQKLKERIKELESERTTFRNFISKNYNNADVFIDSNGYVSIYHPR